MKIKRYSWDVRAPGRKKRTTKEKRKVVVVEKVEEDINKTLSHLLML